MCVWGWGWGGGGGRYENMLSYRVLVARYGVVGGRIVVSGRLDVVWWKNVSSIRAWDGIGVGSWFLDNLGRVDYVVFVGSLVGEGL